MAFDPALFRIIIAESEEDYEVAKNLFNEYAESLAIDLCFQNFDQELENIKSQYHPPQGGIILIFDKKSGKAVGCAGIRKKEAGAGELKRMYIHPDYRNRGLGKELLSRAIHLAIKSGYQRLLLDTLDTMLTAISLYKYFGFCEIPAYYYNPHPNTLYFELKLPLVNPNIHENKHQHLE